MGNSKSSTAKVEPTAKVDPDSPRESNPQRRDSLQTRLQAVMAFQRVSLGAGDESVGPSVMAKLLDIPTTDEELHALGLDRIAEAAHVEAAAPTEEELAQRQVNKVKAFHASQALASGSSVMKDPPRNVFGPGMVVSPDVYADMHKSGPYDRFLLTFHKLSHEERLSCFETMGFFQGKMGYVLRTCDTFCFCQELYDLFKKMREVTECVLQLPHGRLWRLDKQMNVAICLFNNDADDDQNGRALPLLGSFPGAVARERRVLLQNDATADARFGSWQYKEMQAATGEKLACILGVPLMVTQPDGEKAYELIYEAYGPELTLKDGSDCFLLQTLADYAGPAAGAILTRWKQNQVASLPPLLLQNDSLAGFMEALKRQLAVTFGAEDVEVFLSNSILDLVGSDSDMLIRFDHQEDDAPKLRRAGSNIPDIVLLQGNELTQISVRRSGIAPNVALEVIKNPARPAVHNCQMSKRDKWYDAEVDGEASSLLTFAVTVSGKMPHGLVAVVQLRNRRWTAGAKAEAHCKKLCGFTSTDAGLVKVMERPIKDTLMAAVRMETARATKYKACILDNQIRAIRDVTQHVVANLGRDELFRKVVKEICSLLSCDRATMFLQTEDRSCLYSMVAPYPPTTDKLIPIQVPINEKSIVGHCVLDSKLSNLIDAYEDPRFNKRVDKQTGYRTRSLLTVPLVDMRTQDCLGCFQCLNKLDKTGGSIGQYFSDSDIKLCQAFCSIVTAALARTRYDLATDQAVVLSVRNQALAQSED